MAMDGPVLCGEIHAALVNDVDTPTTGLDEDSMQLIGKEYCNTLLSVCLTWTCRVWVQHVTW